MIAFLRSIMDGLASIASWGAADAARAHEAAGLDDPRSDWEKDGEAIRGDWETVERDFATAQQNVAAAIKNGTVTADDFQRLGDAYGAHVKASVRR